ncbi:MAG: hypothetical protein ACRD0K_07355 [Egibacteraceae bacterium]
MIAAHVRVTTAPDYLTRREPHRQAHVERLLLLRSQGLVIAAGPAPDGRSAEVFYRTSEPGQLERLVTDDPYTRGGAWAAHVARDFSVFVSPASSPPVVLDGSRLVTILEGPAEDPEKAPLALAELRAGGRLAFGGLFEEGQTLAVLATDDPRAATRWLAETGLWSGDRLTARPLLYVL